MSPQTQVALASLFVVVFVAVVAYVIALATRTRRRVQQLKKVQQRWQQEMNRDPSEMARLIKLTLSTASDLTAAKRYLDAMEVVDWLIATDGLPTSARICGLQTMAIIFRAQKDDIAGTNCDRWADMLDQSSGGK